MYNVIVSQGRNMKNNLKQCLLLDKAYPALPNSESFLLLCILSENLSCYSKFIELGIVHSH